MNLRPAVMILPDSIKHSDFVIYTGCIYCEGQTKLFCYLDGFVATLVGGGGG
jgi:hypothetical protein